MSHKVYSESELESFAIKEVKKAGGFTRKVVYQGRRNAPDRWCFFPSGRLLILEIKMHGDKPRPGQRSELKRLQDQGFNAQWVDSREGILEAIASA